MSKWDKLILRIKSLDKDMRFEEFYVALVKEIVEMEEKKHENN